MKQSAKLKNSIRLAREVKSSRLGFELIIGIDEAGRGPLAGPVVAGAAAWLDFKARDDEFRYLLDNVADSKKLSAKKREIIYRIIVGRKDMIWGSGRVEPKTIDRINILEASKLAMEKAVAMLLGRARGKFLSDKICCLIDGNFSIDIPYVQESIIGGDDKVFSISAASIIAKVERDRLMVRLDKKYPVYEFAMNKGYPTARHRALLEQYGVCSVHRLSFSPCADSQRRDIINIENKIIKK